MNKPMIAGALLAGAMITQTNAAELDSEEKQLSYIFGMYAGQGLQANNVAVDMDAFIAGVNDMLKSKQPQLDQVTIKKVIDSFDKRRAKEIAKIMNEKQQAAKAYMAENGKKAGVITTDSGLQYKIIKAGDGEIPTDKDKVLAHYKGSLINGTVFDSSYDRGEPAQFPVTGVIQGWQEVLQLMKEGAKWEVVVPPNLAYGPRGAGQGSMIGPNETLIFEIELIAITQ